MHLKTAVGRKEVGDVDIRIALENIAVENTWNTLESKINDRKCFESAEVRRGIEKNN